MYKRQTFCRPEIASVGITQAQAEEKFGKANVETAKFNLAGNGKSQMLGADGFVKLVRQKDGPIVGFHAIGARMGEQIGEGETMVAWEAFPEDYNGLFMPIRPRTRPLAKPPWHSLASRFIPTRGDHNVRTY